MDHVGWTYTRELGAVVYHPFTRSYECIEENVTVEVDERHSRERGLGAVDPYAYHLAIDRDVLSWSEKNFHECIW